MTSWRLFLDAEHEGAHNMAVDEALLLSHARGFSPPTLRFYGWNPGCLSLGRLQKQLPDSVSSAVAPDFVAPDFVAPDFVAPDFVAPDFDVVRRPTGGRAVWHAQEITYCAVVRAELLPAEARSVAGAYAWLSAGFVRGLQALGLPVEMAPGGVRTGGANCFAASAGCDFVVGGKKLIGAAQCRKDDAILQHGSLLLAIDEEKWRQTTGGSMESATSLGALGSRFGRDSIIAALCAGFASEAKVSWERDGLKEREAALAQLLCMEKYRSRDWTFEALWAEEAQLRLADLLGS